MPELPELPDCAEPSADAFPVLPEFALPDPASVKLPPWELASPVSPPVVEPMAVLLPLSPEVAVAVEPFVALPVLPDVAPPVPCPFVGWWWE